ncbi:MAG TPA: HEAT repeat domain-containing protein [Bdellovibrionota bacterium]|nr:HEAT repeat domain-containing protein [Bdellovibrionota bacterium]
MRIELIGLAYDRDTADAVWSGMSAREAYDVILRDDFRRKVDPRSLLYHKGQVELLGNLEMFLKQGGENLSLVELMARRFSAGVEDFPTGHEDLAFDFQLIRHFSSLAMADDFMVADTFLRELLRRIGFLKNGSAWSLVEARDFEGIASALRDVRMQDILDAGHSVPKSEGISFENLVRNYIEFLSYSRNNHLSPFFYNSESDFKRWGDLNERKNRRSEIIVDASLRGRKPAAPSEKRTKKTPPKTLDVRGRFKLRREIDALLEGLSDPDPLIRQKAAETIGVLAEPEILPRLIAALTEAEAEVRQEIVRAIGTLRNVQVTETLLSVLARDEVLSIKLTAADALRRQGEKKLLPVLLDEMESGRPHVGVLLAFHPGLSKDRVTIGRLKTLSLHENPVVRRDVAFVAGHLSGNPGQKEGKEILRRLVHDRDDETRCNALYSLLEIGDREVESYARECAEAPSEIICRAGTIVRHWTGKKPKNGSS